MKRIESLLRWAAAGWILMKLWPHQTINAMAIADWVAVGSVVQYGFGLAENFLGKRDEWPVGKCVHCGGDREPGICVVCRHAVKTFPPDSGPQV